MFKRLKNRFLLLNLVIISFMMLVSFMTIYTITYQDVRRDIDLELRKISDFLLLSQLGMFDPPLDRPIPDTGNMMPQRSVAFGIHTDSNWNLKSSESWFDIDNDDLYTQALEEAKARGVKRSSGQFKLDGNDWAYTVRPDADGYMLVFLDVTARQGILTNLIYTFLAVGLAMLVVIFFISRFFANRSIEPVQEAFEKQKQFIADASHELRTPLSVMLSSIEALQLEEALEREPFARPDPQGL